MQIKVIDDNHTSQDKQSLWMRTYFKGNPLYIIKLHLFFMKKEIEFQFLEIDQLDYKENVKRQITKIRNKENRAN